MFKGFIKKLKRKADVVRIKETWFKPTLGFVIQEYSSEIKDIISGNGGGRAIFIKEGIKHGLQNYRQSYKMLNKVHSIYSDYL